VEQRALGGHSQPCWTVAFSGAPRGYAAVRSKAFSSRRKALRLIYARLLAHGCEIAQGFPLRAANDRMDGGLKCGAVQGRCGGVIHPGSPLGNRPLTARVSRGMRAFRAVSATLFVAMIAACGAAATQSPSAELSPAPAGSPSVPPVVSPGPTDGPEKLVVDLEAAGAVARVGELFVGDPFEAQGGLMCVGSEPVQLYVFGSVRAREEAVKKIDPKDPSNMGTTMVDWNGSPRMWQRDRMIVIYLGEDPRTDQLLRSVLGEPFASGQGRPPLPGPKTCG
jgi:hypothetical protein